MKDTQRMLMILPTMDKDLTHSLELLKQSTTIKYVSRNSTDKSHSFKQLVICKEKLDGCPDQSKFVNRLERKILKTSSLKSYRYSRHLCVLIIASVGYGVNSSIFEDVSDVFIERCWECIQYVLFNISDPIKTWLMSSIDGRNPRSFSALFCPPRQVPESATIESIFHNRLRSIHEISIHENDIPRTIWHRDDIITQTILTRFKQ